MSSGHGEQQRRSDDLLPFWAARGKRVLPISSEDVNFEDDGEMMDNGSEIRRDRRSFMNSHHRPNNNLGAAGIVLKNRPARPAPEGGPADPGFWAVRGKKDDITA